MAKSGIAAKLDWNRMLGFEQIPEVREALRSDGTSAIGAKVGEKTGTKAGLKIGGKVGGKIGAKAGVKTF